MRDASVSSSNCRARSGHVRTGALVIWLMIVSCASCCSFPHTNEVSFFVNWNNGVAIVEKSLQNMQWYPAHPRNPLTCLSVWRVLG